MRCRWRRPLPRTLAVPGSPVPPPPNRAAWTSAPRRSVVPRDAPIPHSPPPARAQAPAAARQRRPLSARADRRRRRRSSEPGPPSAPLMAAPAGEAADDGAGPAGERGVGSAPDAAARRRHRLQSSSGSHRIRRAGAEPRKRSEGAATARAARPDRPARPPDRVAPLDARSAIYAAGSLEARRHAALEGAHTGSAGTRPSRRSPNRWWRRWGTDRLIRDDARGRSTTTRPSTRTRRGSRSAT